MNFLVWPLMTLLPFGAPGESRIDVRVGIVAYEDFQVERTELAQVFERISARQSAYRFRLAAGSYGDVLHWLDKGYLDIAILTPGIFASALQSGRSPDAAPPFQYVATVGLPEATSTWAASDRREQGFSDEYRSVCLVADSSELRTADDLIRAIKGRQVELLYVHRLSASGYLAPAAALRAAGLSLENTPFRFTYSHSQSIRLLNDRVGKRQRVAFVWDDAARVDPQLERSVRRIPLPTLDRISIPHDVVVARSSFAHVEPLRQMLLDQRDPARRYQFTYHPDWSDRFENVRAWVPKNRGDATSDDGHAVSLDEIGSMLLQYARSQPERPRLALVLSGGGAKCSYQVGAVAAIENRLAQLRRENSDYPVDISLVVGTSGGAINSLPVAMHVARTPQGQKWLEATWQQLDQRDIVRPPTAVRVNMGLWFALIQFCLIWFIVSLVARSEGTRLWALPYSLLVLAIIQFLLAYVRPVPWNWLGTRHGVHHAWLWFGFGMRGSAWCLLAIGAILLMLAWTTSSTGRNWKFPRRTVRALLWTGILGLPLLQILTICLWEETLSDGLGMENALATHMPTMINNSLPTSSEIPLIETDPKRATTDRLKSISRQIIEQHRLRRDLVITASCLQQSNARLPSDLYFFAPASDHSPNAPFGSRGIPLEDHPDVLLDVVLGSSSIFPVFPARTIKGIPERGQHVTLIDGGFAHNSPVEAAVLWGATHIILIDVMPRKRGLGHNFIENVISSGRHLHRQAQLIDARSHEKVRIFTLAPDPARLCVLDFSENLIRANIALGYENALRNGLSATPLFRKEWGQPVLNAIRPTPKPGAANVVQ